MPATKITANDKYKRLWKSITPYIVEILVCPLDFQS